MGVINLSFRNSFGSQNRILDSNILCASGLSGSSIMTNEVTVITGASSGIGAALAKQLGSKGHQLVLAARREKQLKEVAKQAGTRALVVPTDVTRRADVEELRSQALKEYGHLDVWVNNAGRRITKSHRRNNCWGRRGGIDRIVREASDQKTGRFGISLAIELANARERFLEARLFL